MIANDTAMRPDPLVWFVENVYKLASLKEHPLNTWTQNHVCRDDIGGYHMIATVKSMKKLALKASINLMRHNEGARKPSSMRNEVVEERDCVRKYLYTLATDLNKFFPIQVYPYFGIIPIKDLR